MLIRTFVTIFATGLTDLLQPPCLELVEASPSLGDAKLCWFITTSVHHLCIYTNVSIMHLFSQSSHYIPRVMAEGTGERLFLDFTSRHLFCNVVIAEPL